MSKQKTITFVIDGGKVRYEGHGMIGKTCESLMSPFTDAIGGQVLEQTPHAQQELAKQRRTEEASN